MENNSQSGSLNIKDWKSIGRGLLITLGGAAASYAIVTLGNIDWSSFGKYAPVATVIGAALINILRKWSIGPTS